MRTGQAETARLARRSRTIRHILIVGPGGIGATFAALLARAGECRVSLLGRRGAQIEAIRKRGLKLEGDVTFTVNIDAHDDPQALDSCDVLVYAVKAQHTEEALAATAHVEVRSFVSSIQNGVRKDAQLAETFGPERVVGALAVVAGERVEPGAVRLTYDGGTRFGELDGTSSERVRWLIARCTNAGLKVEESTNITAATWTKLVGWGPIGLLATLTRLANADILSDRLLATTYVEMVRELAAVASAHEVALLDLGPFHVQSWLAHADAEAVASVMNSPLATSASRHSALQDIERSEPTELGVLLGPLLEDADAHALEIPHVRALYALLMGLERSLQ